MSNVTPAPLDSGAAGSLASPGMEPGAEPGRPAVRLWAPRDVGVVSFLLGFPAGLGLAAVNWHHLGRRASAYGLLVTGAVLVLVLSFVVHLPPGLAIPLNSAITVVLYVLAKRQANGADEAGRVVEANGVLRGFLVSVGGWIATLLPTVVLFFVLTFLGAQVAAILDGTVEFGTGATSASSQGQARHSRQTRQSMSPRT